MYVLQSMTFGPLLSTKLYRLYKFVKKVESILGFEFRTEPNGFLWVRHGDGGGGGGLNPFEQYRIHQVWSTVLSH